MSNISEFCCTGSSVLILIVTTYFLKAQTCWVLFYALHLIFPLLIVWDIPRYNTKVALAQSIPSASTVWSVWSDIYKYIHTHTHVEDFWSTVWLLMYQLNRKWHWSFLHWILFVCKRNIFATYSVWFVVLKSKHGFEELDMMPLLTSSSVDEIPKSNKQIE